MNIFDSIKRFDPDGSEFWSSRDLAKALEYTDYRNFEEVMTKARIACNNSRQAEIDHFVDVNEMVPLGSGAERQIKSVFLLLKNLVTLCLRICQRLYRALNSLKLLNVKS